MHPILGSPRATAWKNYAVKGSLVAARRRYAQERWADAGVREIEARLDQRARKIFCSEILSFAWYGFDTLAAIDDALIAGPMRGDVTLMKQFGDDIARYDLSTLYRMLFKLGTPSFIIKRAGVIYSTYVRGGVMVAESAGDGHARVSLKEGSLPLYFCAHGVPGWLGAALGLSGATNVGVEETECVHRGAHRCVWEATWT